MVGQFPGFSSSSSISVMELKKLTTWKQQQMQIEEPNKACSSSSKDQGKGSLASQKTNGRQQPLYSFRQGTPEKKL